MSVSKRVRIYTAEDVAQHASATSCWVARAGKVYDITTFLPDHPGGDDIVVKYAGQDIGAVMKDPAQHEHSAAAYDMLDEFSVGRLGEGENIVDRGMSARLFRT
jgi:4-hydroxysphinganine ceramide fatty acyl 2-hydroxylase